MPGVADQKFVNVSYAGHVRVIPNKDVEVLERYYCSSDRNEKLYDSLDLYDQYF